MFGSAPINDVDVKTFTVNSLLFARTLFSLIFVNLTTCEFKIHAKYLHRICRVYIGKHDQCEFKFPRITFKSQNRKTKYSEKKVIYSS